MRTLISALFTVVLSFEVASGSAQAAPETFVDMEQPQLTVLSLPAPSGLAPGSLSVAAADNTVADPVAVVAGTAGAAIVSGEAPAFRRVFQLDENYHLDADATPWTLDVSAAFRSQAWAGNTLFILTDVQDPEQVQSAHLVTALWQTAIASGKQAAVRLLLNPDDGFHAGHTYRLRVVQLIQGKEVELAAGNLRLL